MSNADLPVTLTVQQALRRSNIGRSTLYQLIRMGHVKASLVLGRRLIDRASLDATVLSGVCYPPAPSKKRKGDRDRDAA